MSTIFPGSASVGQVYNNYTFDGTAWNINGVDLTENYLEESSASATYLTKVSASNTYVTQTSASTSYAALSGATFTGEIQATKLKGAAVGGDEGGEIFLEKAATNTTLNTGVNIDINQNKLRIFESGGNNRGGYIDLATLPNGVGTNLVPGLTFIKKQTIGSGVSSVTVTNAFSAAYDNYRIIISGGGSSANDYGYMQLGSSQSTYAYATNTLVYSSAAFGGFGNSPSATSWKYVWSNADSTGYTSVIELQNPFLEQYTRITADYATDLYRFWLGGVHKTAASYTDFTLGPNSGSGTISGGIIYVYGYNKGI